jgi:hypothetical protein
MIGMMDKGGQGTTQVPGQQPMQGLGTGLAQLFANNQPAVAPTSPAQIPQIAAPQYGPSLMPSPEQAMAATRARMLARTPAQPLAQPTTARPPAFVHGGGSNR